MSKALSKGAKIFVTHRLSASAQKVKCTTLINSCLNIKPLSNESGFIVVDPIGFEAVKKVNAMNTKRAKAVNAKEKRRALENGVHRDH